MTNENEKRENDRPHIRTTTDVTFTEPVRIDITHRLGDSWFWMIVVICAVIIFFAQLLRADSTFVAIEKAKPRVCEKVCPVCGGCRMIPTSWLLLDNGVRGQDYRCAGDTAKNGRLLFYPKTFDFPDCDSIIWGRWRTICRVDTVWKQVLDSGGVLCRPRIVPIPPATVSGFIERIDTIYTDDPRCDTLPRKMLRYYPDTIPVIPQRGLDSVYTLPHDTVVNCRNEPGPCPGYPGAKPDSTLVGNGLPYYGLTVSCAVLHWREVCDTVKIPGAWWYFNWSNGKRVNMRRVK